MKIKHRSAVKGSSAILAADIDEEEDGIFITDEEDTELSVDDSDDTLTDSIDDIGEQVEDIQDQIEEVDEDEPTIEIDNNIENHYIAECDRCHGIFISAVIESDQEIDHVAGICPLCGKESDQKLRWVIRAIDEEDPRFDV